MWWCVLVNKFHQQDLQGWATLPFLLSNSCMHSTDSSHLSYAPKPVLVLNGKNSRYTDPVVVATSDEILTQNLWPGSTCWVTVLLCKESDTRSRLTVSINQHTGAGTGSVCSNIDRDHVGINTQALSYSAFDIYSSALKLSLSCFLFIGYTPPCVCHTRIFKTPIVTLFLANRLNPSGRF